MSTPATRPPGPSAATAPTTSNQAAATFPGQGTFQFDDPVDETFTPAHLEGSITNGGDVISGTDGCQRPDCVVMAGEGSGGAFALAAIALAVS